MTLRLSEEEFAELMRRRGTTSSAPSGHLPLKGKATSTHAEEVPIKGKANIPHEEEVPLKGKARATKYGNRRVEIDGKRFDSKHEAEVYGELMLRKRAGELRVVLRQVPFDLPGGIKYIADFVTLDFAGNIEVIDAKSPITRQNRVYINKKKQMKSEWGFEVKEV